MHWSDGWFRRSVQSVEDGGTGFGADKGPNCLVAERRWDAARWAIKAHAWRFEGMRRRAARRAR